MKIDPADLLNVQRNLLSDPEIQEAIQDLAFSLSHAETPKAESSTWETFTDRIQYLISRANSAATIERIYPPQEIL